MSDIAVVKALAKELDGWNNNSAWLDTSEDNSCAIVGHIDDDGNLYPVLTVDCEQYDSGDSLKLAKFYALVNPVSILDIANLIDTQQAEIQRLQSIIKEMQRVDDVLAPQKWISVDDRLPQDSCEEVLTYDKSDGKVRTTSFSDWRNIKHYEWLTHWQPLPPKP